MRLADAQMCRSRSPSGQAFGQGSAMSTDAGQAWFSVRCFFEWKDPGEARRRIYEERVLLWHAADFEEAIAKAEVEAEEYVAIREESDPGPQRYLAMAQAYRLSEGDDPGDGIEVFSMLRESNLTPGKYLTRFFDTGHENNGDPIT
jgi:hypothetical protein